MRLLFRGLFFTVVRNRCQYCRLVKPRHLTHQSLNTLVSIDAFFNPADTVSRYVSRIVASSAPTLQLMVCRRPRAAPLPLPLRQRAFDDDWNLTNRRQDIPAAFRRCWCISLHVPILLGTHPAKQALLPYQVRNSSCTHGILPSSVHPFPRNRASTEQKFLHIRKRGNRVFLGFV